MKIVKDGKKIAVLPDSPKNFDAGCKGGTLTIIIGNDDVTLARYATHDEASAVLKSLGKCYLNGESTFNLP